jgi:ATP synthase subunit 6
MLQYFFFDPLEQFSIELFQSYFSFFPHCCNFQRTWSLVTVPSTSVARMVIFNFLLVMLWVYSLKVVFVTNKFQKFIGLTFFFIVSIMKDAVYIKKYSFILLIYTTFVFIFLSNILGMFPYSITVTSHLVLTLYFSLAFFIGSNIIGVCYHKQSFFVLFLPEGVPLLIVPFLILIEYVSYVSRIFSLAIRLFANMLSGHILLKILISFVWTSVSSNIVHWFWNILPMFIVFAVIGLEVSIAFLQAYVFIVLITIYLKDLIHTH